MAREKQHIRTTHPYFYIHSTWYWKL